jgi:hypothetical protein
VHEDGTRAADPNDPLHYSRSGYLYLVQHDVSQLLTDWTSRWPTTGVPAVAGCRHDLVRAGHRCAWRLVPHDLAPWDVAYRWFAQWTRQGVTESIHRHPGRTLRLLRGIPLRHDPRSRPRR